MSKQELKDRNGKTTGTIDTESSGKQVIRDKNGKPKGSYDPKNNETRDHNGRLVGKGNQLSSLL